MGLRPGERATGGYGPLCAGKDPPARRELSGGPMCRETSPCPGIAARYPLQTQRASPRRRRRHRALPRVGLNSAKPRFTAELICLVSLSFHLSFAHRHQSLTLLRELLLVAFSSPVSLNLGLQTLPPAYVSLNLNQGLVLSFHSPSSADHLCLTECTERTGGTHIP